jgi:hypothetical protein
MCNISDLNHLKIWQSSNQNCIHEEIKSRLNACYYSFQNLVFPAPKNLNIKIYKPVILPVVLYGCETWSPTLREGIDRMCFKFKVLRRIFGPIRE